MTECFDCMHWSSDGGNYRESGGNCIRYPESIRKHGTSRTCGELVLKKNDDLIDRIKNNPALNDSYKKMKNAEHEFTMLEILTREDFKND